MYDKLLENYVNKLTKEDITKFALKKGITLKEYELNVIYAYIKKYWKVFYKENPTSIFLDLQTKLETNTYKEIIKLYKEYKNKI